MRYLMQHDADEQDQGGYHSQNDGVAGGDRHVVRVCDKAREPHRCKCGQRIDHDPAWMDGDVDAGDAPDSPAWAHEHGTAEFTSRKAARIRVGQAPPASRTPPPREPAY